MPRQGKCCCKCNEYCDVCTTRRFNLSGKSLQAEFPGLTDGTTPPIDPACTACNQFEGPWPLTYGGDIPTCGSIGAGGPSGPATAASWAEFFGVTSIEWLSQSIPTGRKCTPRACCWGGNEYVDDWCPANPVDGQNANMYFTMTFVIVDGTKLGVVGLVTWVTSFNVVYVSIPLGLCLPIIRPKAGLLIISPTSTKFDCDAAWNFTIPLQPTTPAPGAGFVEMCTGPTDMIVTSL